MIDATELRIGNIVTIAPLNRPHVVTSFTRRNVKLKLDKGRVSITTHKGIDGLDIDGIPLSGEWLIKLGLVSALENNGNLPCFKYGNYTVAKWIGGKWQFWYNAIQFYKCPQTVHELQNFIFALTGKELWLES